MKVAVVCDWLITYAGAEKVLEQILNIYPEADLFAVVDFLSNEQRRFIHHKSVMTTFIQQMPWAKKHYRKYLPLMPLAIEQLDVSAYDLVISSSHCVAKGIMTGPNQVHISYVHSPIRYAWDLQHQYLHEAGLDSGIKGMLAKAILHYMRIWDSRTSNGVDYFISNSQFIAKRIWKCYRRKAAVIYPPVDVEAFKLHEMKEDFYLTASRMVPYKRIDLIVEAFSEMTDRRLVVIGDGPEFGKIKTKAGKNVKLMGYQPFSVLRDYMQRAKAFVFAAEEDFGIVPVEAQACGTPVIAYGRGGALETIIDLEREMEQGTGLFFQEQSIDSLRNAVERFEKLSSGIDNVRLAQMCRNHAQCFSVSRFCREFQEFIQGKVSNGHDFHKDNI